MKNIKFLAIALIAFTSITSQLFAQKAPALKTRTKSNNTNERTSGYDLKTIKCRVIPTETGCTIVFDNIGGVGTLTGSGGAGKNRKAAPNSSSSFSVSAADNSIDKITTPSQGSLNKGREGKIAVIAVSHDMVVSSDPPVSVGASSDSPPSEFSIGEPGVQKVSKTGLGSGKASFSDLSVMSAGKATFKEFTVTKRCDGKTITISCPDGECDIPLYDCSNGTCDLVCSWSWGATNTGSMSSGSGAGSGRCAAGFSLEIEDGTCTAITKKGDLISSYDLATGKK